MAFFSPSMMCANMLNLQEDILKLEAAGVDRMHLDVMDGNFVSNYALGVKEVEAICGFSKLLKEVHLMVTSPSKCVDVFAKAGADIIYFHPQSDYHPTVVIEKIKEAGAEAGIVIDPGTTIESIEELFYICKYVLVMGVNPGHAGQIYLPYVDRKIEKLVALKKEYNIEVCLDGACSEEMIKKWSNKGVDGFVLGTAALFGQKDSYENIIAKLRTL